MTFVLTLVLFMYIFLSLINFLGLDDKRRLSKEIEGKILGKIKERVVVSFDAGDGDGHIYTYPNKLRFRRFPFLIRYVFDDLGWIPFWSPLARELKRLSKKRKDEEKMKKLLRYGLGE